MKWYLPSEVQCTCFTPYRWTTKNLQESKGEIHTSPGYQSRYKHHSWLRTTQPNLAEPGGEGGAQRWLTLRRWDYPSVPLQDNVVQTWKDIFPASPLSRTRGLPDSTATLLLQSTSRLFWRCSEVGRLVTWWKTCRRFIIPHVQPVSSLSSTRDIFYIRYPVNCFEVISLGVV